MKFMVFHGMPCNDDVIVLPDIKIKKKKRVRVKEPYVQLTLHHFWSKRKSTSGLKQTTLSRYWRPAYKR